MTDRDKIAEKIESFGVYDRNVIKVADWILSCLLEKRDGHCEGCPYEKERYCDCGMFDFNDAIDQIKKNLMEEK